ncbi:hypothetical protein LEP1GSC188_4834 [Leptospira weilii serovar Topaz str. LT2116]|uniref:Uncharacterized protein n=1 Tax=Leptospira weilii serovar Topaz str. LT2116 TaxID=1088540 RepID=M3H0X6_9LEPT|nr:hypothetical protein LEP1GSC188_4834 [Leptospira weilii serovar Topaz str. LT2116]
MRVAGIMRGRAHNLTHKLEEFWNRKDQKLTFSSVPTE